MHNRLKFFFRFISITLLPSMVYEGIQMYFISLFNGEDQDFVDILSTIPLISGSNSRITGHRSVSLVIMTSLAAERSANKMIRI